MTAEQERDILRAVVEAIAERDCEYGDDCGPAGLRLHYLCDPCRARRALDKVKP